MARRRAWLVGGAVLVLASMTAGAALLAADDEAELQIVAAGTDVPTSLVALPGGGLLYAEQRGTVREVDPDGRVVPGPVAEVTTDVDDQRGLLGLARDSRGRVFACWTRASDGRLVVGQVAPGPERLVWIGPPTVDRANGGHIEFDGDGDLVVGVGDLLERELIDDPSAPNGKLLVLDPGGPPGQTPEVLSAGWNNPFAFTFTPGGDLWVADNAPPGEPERLARGDLGGRPSQITELEGAVAPAGVVALSEDRLAVCGFLSGEARVFDVAGDRAVEDPDATIEGCTLAAVVLDDGRLAVAGEASIAIRDAPGEG